MTRPVPNIENFDPVPADVIDEAKEAYDPPEGYRYDPTDGKAPTDGRG